MVTEQKCPAVGERLMNLFEESGLSAFVSDLVSRLHHENGVDWSERIGPALSKITCDETDLLRSVAKMLSG